MALHVATRAGARQRVGAGEGAAALAGAIEARADERALRAAPAERGAHAAAVDERDAVRDRETAEEEIRAVNEEAMSVNEEFQTTNEELETSKEELQSLNEELTALNSQLQETLNRYQTLADDLENILNSADVATLFLDRNLRIRFFTPAARIGYSIDVFHVTPEDVARYRAARAAAASQ